MDSIRIKNKSMKLSQYCKEVREKTGLSQNAFAKKKNISHTMENIKTT